MACGVSTETAKRGFLLTTSTSTQVIAFRGRRGGKSIERHALDHSFTPPFFAHTGIDVGSEACFMR